MEDRAEGDALSQLMESLKKFLLDPSSENRDALASLASKFDGDVYDWMYDASRLVNDAELGDECGPNACTSEMALEILFDEFGEDISYMLASNPYIPLELALKLCRIDDGSSDGEGGTPALLARFTRHEQVLRVLADHYEGRVVYEVARNVLTHPDVLIELAKSSYACMDTRDWDLIVPMYEFSVQFAVAMNEKSPDLALQLIASGDYVVTETSPLDGNGNPFVYEVGEEYNKGIQEAARSRLRGQK